MKGSHPLLGNIISLGIREENRKGPDGRNENHGRRDANGLDSWPEI